MTEAGTSHDGRVLVVIPTYDERDNLGPILSRLHAANPRVAALVVDDGSPDGTGELADRLAAADDRVHVLHRAGKDGLGTAYIAGFRWALDRGFDVIVEMDADGSHPPEALPRLLAAGARADLVIGSRYVRGGRVVNWPLRRELLSRGANLYSSLLLGAEVRDITAGFRAYRSEVLKALPLDEVASHGYCFQIDLAWRTLRAGYSVAEVPITFTERQVGQSKMSGMVVREAMVNVARWGLRHRWTQLRSLFGQPPGGSSTRDASK